MSPFYVLLIIAFLAIVIFFLVRAFRRYRSGLPPLLPTKRHPPVESRSRVYHGTSSSTTRSGWLHPWDGGTIHSQRELGKIPPPLPPRNNGIIYQQQSLKELPPLPPRPVVARKLQPYEDHFPVVSTERVHWHSSTKAPGPKTVEPPLTTVYPPSPEPPSSARISQRYSIERVHRPASTKVPGPKKVVPPLATVYPPSPELASRPRIPRRHSISRNELPGPLPELSYGPAVKSPVLPYIEPQPSFRSFESQNAKSPVLPYIEPRPFLSFLSQDEVTGVNDEKSRDGDDDIKSLGHPALRELANKEWENMKNCREEEKSARRSRQFIRVRELKIKAQQHRRRMHELNDRASEMIFAENNKDTTLREIDLHGLTVKEAIDHTNRVLKQARELENSDIRIIVGKGIHSKGGQAKIKPAIRTFLEKNQFPVEVDPRNDGVLVARLNAMPSF